MKTQNMNRAGDDNYGLKAVLDTADFYKTLILVDAATNKRATFKPRLTNKGWTVVLAIGSNKTGRTEHEIGISNTYTLHQAQAVSSALYRDTLRAQARNEMFLGNEIQS